MSDLEGRGRQPSRQPKALKICSGCFEEQPVRRKRCCNCELAFEKSKRIKMPEGKTNPSEQHNHMNMRADVLQKNHETDVIILSVNKTQGGRLAFQMHATDGIAKDFVGTTQLPTQIGETMVLSFLKQASAQRNVPVDIPRWRRRMRKKREQIAIANEHDEETVDQGENETSNHASEESASQPPTNDTLEDSDAQDPIDPDDQLQNIFDQLN